LQASTSGDPLNSSHCEKEKEKNKKKEAAFHKMLYVVLDSRLNILCDASCGN
jgi:hypothetical protein